MTQGTFVKVAKKYNVHLEDMAKVMAKHRSFVPVIVQLDSIAHGTQRIQLNAHLGLIVGMDTFNVCNVSKKAITMYKVKLAAIIGNVVIRRVGEREREPREREQMRVTVFYESSCVRRVICIIHTYEIYYFNIITEYFFLYFYVQYHVRSTHHVRVVYAHLSYTRI